MWHASDGWMQRTVNAGMLKGSGVALLAFTLLHSHEILLFIRCRLVCRGQDADHGLDGRYRDPREGGTSKSPSGSPE